MKNLLESKNIEQLRRLKNEKTLYAFDFDGTLSPITTNHSEAIITADLNYCMSELCSRFPVAIITGRSVQDLKSRIGFFPKYIIGNHGVEGLIEKQELEEMEGKCKELIQLYNAAFGESFNKLGMEIEDKRYSFSLHYSKAKDFNKVYDQLLRVINFLPADALVVNGKNVVNILPNKKYSKGFAFLKLLKLEGAQAGFFIGDDVTDEDIFRLDLPGLFTVRVGKSENSKAQFYLDSQIKIHSLISCILN